MKTVVYQSYRTKDVSTWMQRCLHSVSGWAKLYGFEYVFIDDRFFDYVPQWYKDKTREHKLPMSDLARLEVAREFLSDGYERTIWVDADVLVFDPEQFRIEVQEEFAFCREIFLRKQELLGITLPVIRRDRKVNNAVTVFTKNNSILEFYRMWCYKSAEQMTTFDAGFAGTTFLTWLNRRLKLPFLTNVGLLSPLILNDLATGKDKYIRLYMEKFAHPVYAANLCNTFNNGHYMGIHVDDALFERAINVLLETKGNAINKFLEGASLHKDNGARKS